MISLPLWMIITLLVELPTGQLISTSKVFVLKHSKSFKTLIYLFIHRDKTEEVKKLTNEERLEISKKENASSSTTSTYSSPRRERGLKIYLDSPKKRDDP